MTFENVVYDIETDGLLDTVTKVHCICIRDRDDPTTFRDFFADSLKKGLEILQDAETVTGHNILTFDNEVLRRFYGIDLDEKSCDTLVLSRLLFPEIKDVDFKIRAKHGDDALPGRLIGSHGLEAWGYRLRDMKGEFGKNPDNFAEFSEQMLEYCRQDVKLTQHLYQKFVTIGIPEQASELEHEVQKIVFRQEKRGWKFDRAKAEALYAELSAKRDELKSRLKGRFTGWYVETKTPRFYQFNAEGYPVIEASNKADCQEKAYDILKPQFPKITKKFIGEHILAGPNRKKHVAFNPGSADHIARVFGEQYGWVPTVFNEKDGKPSITSKILEELPFEEAKWLIEYEVLQDRCEKLNDARAGWLKHLDVEDRIHGSVMTNGTPTRRATHRNPNLGQVPANDKPYGKECRSLFTVPAGYKLITSDADALELRCLAHYLFPYDAGRYAEIVDKGKREEGTDIHTMNQMAGKLPTRDDAKTLIYLIIFGGGPKKAQESLGIPYQKAMLLVNSFKTGITGYQQLIDAISRTLSQRGHLKALDGAKLFIRKDYAALNTLIQSAGAIICKTWMIEIDKLIKEHGLEGHCGQVGWVHDELSFEVKEDYVDVLKPLFQQAMTKTEQILGVKCPLKCGADVGDNWSETH